MSGNGNRTDEFGRAFKGSQLQIQIYVNRRRNELEAGLRDAFSDLAETASSVDWVSPLEADGFVEYQDSAFLRALRLGEHAPQLSEFWPSGGPVWDALARTEQPTQPERPGVVLVEAKSYPDEMKSRCRASDASRQQIEGALDAVAAWLGVVRTQAWTEVYYQLANRVAHLYFFQEILGVPAWLCEVSFVGDPHRPTSVSEWESAIERVARELGLPPEGVPYHGHVFLPAHSRDELLSHAVDVWGGLSN